MIGAAAALLFAVPIVRNIQPNVPPIGTLSDVIGSFFFSS